jgi:CheY-like chemotaxis protein
LAPKAIVRPSFVVCEAGNSLRHLLNRYLHDVDIVPVSNLAEALQEISREHYQTILINDVSITKALQRLKSVVLPSGTLALVCSIPGTGEAASALGASDYLVKPVSQETLLAALDRLDLGGRTVLIVDDEPEALRLFRRMLASSGRGYRLLGATDGQQAVNILRERRPDVVLLDLVMPNMDGFRLLEVKNQDSELSGIPVIVISARDSGGQPIISSSMAITCRDGLSAYRLLSCIDIISTVFSSCGPPAGLVQTATPPG